MRSTSVPSMRRHDRHIFIGSDSHQRARGAECRADRKESCDRCRPRLARSNRHESTASRYSMAIMKDGWRCSSTPRRFTRVDFGVWYFCADPILCAHAARCREIRGRWGARRRGTVGGLGTSDDRAAARHLGEDAERHECLAWRRGIRRSRRVGRCHRGPVGSRTILPSPLEVGRSTGCALGSRRRDQGPTCAMTSEESDCAERNVRTQRRDLPCRCCC